MVTPVASIYCSASVSLKVANKRHKQSKSMATTAIIWDNHSKSRLAGDTIMPVWCVMPDIDGLRADFLTMMSDDDLQKCLPETVVELRPSLGSQAEVAIRA